MKHSRLFELQHGLYAATQRAGQTLQKSAEHQEALRDMKCYKQEISKISRRVVSLTTEPTQFAKL